jgi:hypothetical protein
VKRPEQVNNDKHRRIQLANLVLEVSERLKEISKELLKEAHRLEDEAGSAQA